jgi:hypothetical protein
MNQTFCADRARCLDETPIGTASQHSTYVLIECPTPWTTNASDSQAIPALLSQTMQAIAKGDASVRFLLINRNQTQVLGCRSVIIYRRSTQEFCQGYDQYEFAVDGLQDAAIAIQNFFEQRCGHSMLGNRTPDLLICTHGSHDQCCARYGNPFYAAAQKVVQTMPANDIRVWRSSHFGGHRFAPTAITFPDGRYYARLDTSALKSILMQTGNIDQLRSHYRGWGLLPNALQVMEQELLQRHGWNWYKFPIAHKILMSDQSMESITALLQYSIQGEIINCYGDLSLDQGRTMSLQASCHANTSLISRKYKLDRLAIFPAQRLSIAH